MAVLNPPRVFPGIGRSIVNFLIENRNSWDEDRLVDAFKPQGVNEDTAASTGVKNTVSALRALRVLTPDSQGSITVSDVIIKHGTRFDRDEFRRLMLNQVLDLGRDGDPWLVGEDKAATFGARDLTRGLSWLLAQDALGPPLRWNGAAEDLQFAQFGPDRENTWAVVNDWQWGPFVRWSLALGLAVPSVIRSKSGLIPIPTVALSGVIAEMPPARMPIQDFLGALSAKIPVIHGGVIRSSLVARLGYDPDPGVQGNAVDTSIAQALRILEGRGSLTFESLADADGVLLSRFDQRRTTHVTLPKGNKR